MSSKLKTLRYFSSPFIYCYRKYNTSYNKPDLQMDPMMYQSTTFPKPSPHNAHATYTVRQQWATPNIKNPKKSGWETWHFCQVPTTHCHQRPEPLNSKNTPKLENTPFWALSDGHIYYFISPQKNLYFLPQMNVMSFCIIYLIHVSYFL